MKSVPLVLVVLGLVGQASAEPLDAAIARAKAEHKPLVVEVGAEWCGPCKAFEKTVLPDPRLKGPLGSVILVRYDADEDQGKEAIRRLSVRAYPTFLVVDARGAVMRRWEGSPDGDEGVQQFLEVIRLAAGAIDDEATVFARLKAHRGDLAIELDAARWYVMRGLTREAISHFDAVAKDARATGDQRYEALTTVAHLRRVIAWRAQLIGDTVSLLRAEPGRASVDDLLVATVGSTLSPDEAKALVATVLAAQTDDAKLNSMVYVALAAGANDAALTAASAIVKRRHYPQFIDTLAEVHHARGEKAEALKLEDEALELAPYERELHDNRTRFASSRQDAPSVLLARRRADLLRTRLEKADRLDPARATRNDDPETGRKQMMDAYKVQEAVTTAVIQRCRNDVGKTREAYATAHVDGSDRVFDVTVFADDNTKPALRACLKRELMGQRLPAAYERDDNSRFLSFGFGR